MKKESAVQFLTERRIHVALAVTDVAQATRFYQILFNQEPTKERPGYAKFEVAEPPVNLALNQTTGPAGPSNPVAHFGIQVKSTEAVQAMADRLAAAGLATQAEENVTCCYAVQDKVWVTDPDGNKWEIFVVLDNDAAQYAMAGSDCCSEMDELEGALRRGDQGEIDALRERDEAAAVCCSSNSKPGCC